MNSLYVDIETYSEVDLLKCGMHAYAEHPSTEILLFGYAFDDEPVQVVDLAQGEQLPLRVEKALLNPNILKIAWNAAFELNCLQQHLNCDQWTCAMVHACYLGLPGSLDKAGKILNTQTQKAAIGKTLLRYFTKPCKPTKANGGRTRNLPCHDPEKWLQFKAYCRDDVETERQIYKKLQTIPLPAFEQYLWQLDYKINRHGVLLDKDLVDHAIACSEQFQQQIMTEAVKLTGLDNPNSISQLKEWLQQAAGLEVESLNKKAIPDLLAQTDNATVTRVLELRQLMSKSSVKKYNAMNRAICSDGRVRGLLQFYGSHTGRWAGRLVQVQNLPRNTIPDLDDARELLRCGRYDDLKLLYNVPETLSQLVRTAFVAPEGHRFIVCDFSAIEARIVAWLAGEEWAIKEFQGAGKIYEATAAQMFKVPIEDVTHGSDLRQKGKVATLACGYQGGPGALIKMGALDQGLKEEELPDLVAAWRAANPHIVQLWRDVEKAAITAVKERKIIQVKCLTFAYVKGLFRITLPSGRSLYYVRPRISTDPQYGRETLSYEGTEQKGWTRIHTYGGKLVENIVQAIARDCLAQALKRLDDHGYKIVFHVHDEVVVEVENGRSSAETVAKLVSDKIPWAPGLPLAAEAFETVYYKKE